MDYLRKEILKDIEFLKDEINRLTEENKKRDDLDIMRAYYEGKIKAYKDQIYTYEMLLDLF